MVIENRVLKKESDFSLEFAATKYMPVGSICFYYILHPLDHKYY